jgi:cyclic pyranopterin phosphate synthase
LANKLSRAGLERVNISLDTLRPDKFGEITRGGSLHTVLAGVARSVAAGLTPVKLNVVLVPGFSEPEIVPLARLTLRSSVHVRFCGLVSCGKDLIDRETAGLSGATALELIEAELGGLRKIDPTDKGSVAVLYRLPGAKGLIGIVDAACGRLCSSCTRMRLTARGTLRPCLFDDTEMDIVTPLRSGTTDDDIEMLLREAAAAKRNPESPFTPDVNAPMNIVGG